MGKSSVVRFLRYAFYDWTREMPPARRLIAIIGLGLQGYAIWALMSRSLVWPVIWPSKLLLFAIACVLYMLGYFILNAMLTSEFLRKTQLEADQTAAQRIQQTLQPEGLEQRSGYHLTAFYRPFRAVGGDYFDVIDVSENQTLFALADVSGKGTPAALLSSNIQALVRSIVATENDVVALATRINQHLNRYTPSDRFATAVFILLNRDSGQIAYVNAGHNSPVLCGANGTVFLESTGFPLGLFAASIYEKREATLGPGDTLLIYTDGLTDSISGDDPEDRLRTAVTADSRASISNLEALIDPRLSEDDVTILLAKRLGSGLANEPETSLAVGL